MYAEVVIDLWPCDYDLNDEGVVRLCLAFLEAPAKRAATRQSSVFCSACRSVVQITRVRREEANALASQLLAIVCDEGHQEPLPFPEEGDAA
jgi:hypothetical protein